MEGIEYEPELNKRQQISFDKPRRSWAISLVMKLGGKYIKTEEQAQKVLIIVAVIFFLISFYNFFL
jgi:hypothetical protein